MLDLRKLLLLRELHARGTVAAVAEARAFTPSAVSQQLAQLQREAGVALTERVGRRLRLTDAGLRLVAHADALLARIEEAEAELQTAAGAVHGRLRIASLQTPMLALVAPAMGALAGAYPHLRVELVEMEPEHALPALALGEFDLVVAEEYDDAPRRRYPELVREALCRDEIRVVLPAGHPLAAADGPIELSALADEPWLSPHPDTQFARSQLRTCRVIGGFEPDVRHWANDTAILLTLVAAHQGVGLLPGLAHAERDERIAVRGIAGSDLARTIFAFTRASATDRPAVRALVDALRDAARREAALSGSR
jgi:DNA-binding transcriptional LysR family regulator